MSGRRPKVLKRKYRNLEKDPIPTLAEVVRQTGEESEIEITRHCNYEEDIEEEAYIVFADGIRQPPKHMIESKVATPMKKPPSIR